MLLSVYHVVLKENLEKTVVLYYKQLYYESCIVKIVQNRCFLKEMPNFYYYQFPGKSIFTLDLHFL